MLLLASSVCGLFKWRQFELEVILMAVGWYLRFSLSYRDVEELLAERGLQADHVTVWRWVQRYAPEVNRRLRSRFKPTNDSWRVDETYVRVKGTWVYLYRAVDSSGATIDFLLSAKRDAAAAERFLAKALGRENHLAPRVINTDKHAGYPPAIVRLKAEDAYGLSFHALRHTAVSLLRDAGTPEAVVMELVGHDSKAMSAHYTHVGIEALAKAVAALPEISRLRLLKLVSL